MPEIDRRGFMKAAGVALAAGAGAATASGALATMYSADVDEGLFKAINRVKDPEKMTGTELHHVPVLTAPGKVKPGGPFMVEVKVGKELHDTNSGHRITEITLLAGNEPVGTAVFTSLFSRPSVAFLVSVDTPVTLIAQARCNLHGVWESAIDVTPA